MRDDDEKELEVTGLQAYHPLVCQLGILLGSDAKKMVHVEITPVVQFDKIL